MNTFSRVKWPAMALSSLKKLYSLLTISLTQLQGIAGFRLPKHMIGAPISSFTDDVLCLMLDAANHPALQSVRMS